MRAGQLDRRITIRSRGTIQSAATGAVSEVFTDLVTLWAAKLDERGRQFAAARQMNAETTDVFEIRWYAGITELHQIASDGREYDILHVAEVGRRKGMHLLAKAKTS